MFFSDRGTFIEAATADADAPLSFASIGVDDKALEVWSERVQSTSQQVQLKLNACDSDPNTVPIHELVDVLNLNLNELVAVNGLVCVKQPNLFNSTKVGQLIGHGYGELFRNIFAQAAFLATSMKDAPKAIPTQTDKIKLSPETVPERAAAVLVLIKFMREVYDELEAETYC